MYVKHVPSFVITTSIKAFNLFTPTLHSMFSNRHYPRCDEPFAATIRRACKVCCRSTVNLCMSLLRPQIQRKSYSLHRPFQNCSLQFDKPHKTCNIVRRKHFTDFTSQKPIKAKLEMREKSRGCVFKVHMKWEILPCA